MGLVVFLIPGGHCQPQTTALQGTLQFLTTNSIDKCQAIPAFVTCVTNGLQDFLANYPQDCAPAFISVSNSSNIVSGGSINQNAITAAYRLICQPRCGNPLIAYYNRVATLRGMQLIPLGMNARGTVQAGCVTNWSAIY